MRKIALVIFVTAGLICCSPDLPIRMDSSVSNASRSDLSSSSQEIDYMQIGIQLLQKKEYTLAFHYFHHFSVKNPEDASGFFYCGQAKYQNQKYTEAMYFFQKSAMLGFQSPDLAQSIIRCHHTILEKQLENAYYCKGQELQEILTVFIKFRKSLEKNDWMAISSYASLFDLLYSMGVASQDEVDLEKNIVSYLGFITSPMALTYLDFLRVVNVKANGSTAHIVLEGIEHKNRDGIYLRKIHNRWHIVLFLHSLFGEKKL